ncbi:MAG: hypothetical protein ACOYOT_04345 [Bacteroidales bacterium]
MSQSMYIVNIRVESKAEIVYKEGKFVEVRITDVQGKEPLDAQSQKKLLKLVEAYREDIVRKWIDFFVYNIPVVSETITKRI